MKIIFFFLILLLLLLFTYNIFTSQKLLGKKAPDFTLPDESGILHTLSTLRGSKVALYFYPKDYTPGCTAQACNIRDNYELLKEHAITIFGISTDIAQSHKKFQDSYHLPFHLLTATTDILKAYQVDGLLFTKRHTFLIDEHGIIIKIISHVKTDDHVQQIIDGFKKK